MHPIYLAGHAQTDPDGSLVVGIVAVGIVVVLVLLYLIFRK
jgi:hypothetical protein